MKSTVITFPVLAKTGKPSRRPVVEQSPHPFGIALDRKQQAFAVNHQNWSHAAVQTRDRHNVDLMFRWQKGAGRDVGGTRSNT